MLCLQAFKLFDMDGDGMITKDELRKLVEKVGGSMTEGEAKGLIHQADKDGNESIDFSEFSKLWAAIKGEGEVRIFGPNVFVFLLGRMIIRAMKYRDIQVSPERIG